MKNNEVANETKPKRKSVPRRADKAHPDARARERMTRKSVEDALRLSRGQIAVAAELMGRTRRALSDWIKRYDEKVLAHAAIAEKEPDFLFSELIADLKAYVTGKAFNNIADIIIEGNAKHHPIAVQQQSNWWLGRMDDDFIESSKRRVQIEGEVKISIKLPPELERRRQEAEQRIVELKAVANSLESADDEFSEID